MAENSISIYKGDLTAENFVLQNIRIKTAFPDLTEAWYKMFQERIIENKFTDERLKDAVDYVIDNCEYPRPSIAQFIKFDKKIELKTHDQLLKMHDEDKNIFHYYEGVKIDGYDKIMYARKEDFIKYKLKPFWKDKGNTKEFNDNSKNSSEILNNYNGENAIKELAKAFKRI